MLESDTDALCDWLGVSDCEALSLCDWLGDPVPVLEGVKLRDCV